MAKLKNLKREKFCKTYVCGDVEFFGNGTQSYIEAYEPDTSKPNWLKSVMSSASRLLRDVKVIDRINELLEEIALNDQFVDKQLSFLITQHADFKSKLGAIKEYNKLKQRIIEKKEVKITEYNKLDDEQLDEEIEKRENRTSKTS